MSHVVKLRSAGFQWQWKVFVCILELHLSFLCVVLNVEMCDMGIPSCRVVVLFVGSDIGFGGWGMGGGKGGGT